MFDFGQRGNKRNHLSLYFLLINTVVLQSKYLMKNKKIDDKNNTSFTWCAGISIFSSISFMGRTAIFSLRELSKSFRRSMYDPPDPAMKIDNFELF